jgi:hypothetical protein
MARAGMIFVIVADESSNEWLAARRIEMASAKQRTAAKRNVKKAAAAAKRKRTVAHLPKSTRTALGKQGAKVRKQKHS